MMGGNGYSGIERLSLLAKRGDFLVIATRGVSLLAVVDAAMKFFNEFKAKRIPLSTGGEMFFAPSPEALERYGYDAVAAWAEYAIHQVTSDGGASAHSLVKK